MHCDTQSSVLFYFQVLSGECISCALNIYNVHCTLILKLKCYLCTPQFTETFAPSQVAFLPTVLSASHPCRLNRVFLDLAWDLLRLNFSLPASFAFSISKVVRSSSSREISYKQQGTNLSFSIRSPNLQPPLHSSLPL